MIRNPACLFVCDWDNFKEFGYFLIINQVKSVVKIFRQILEGSPDFVSYFTFLGVGLQQDSC
jgi:hypothetical protein